MSFNPFEGAGQIEEPAIIVYKLKVSGRSSSRNSTPGSSPRTSPSLQRKRLSPQPSTVKVKPPGFHANADLVEDDESEHKSSLAPRNLDQALASKDSDVKHVARNLDKALASKDSDVKHVARNLDKALASKDSDVKHVARNLDKALASKDSDVKHVASSQHEGEECSAECVSIDKPSSDDLQIPLTHSENILSADHQTAPDSESTSSANCSKLTLLTESESESADWKPVDISGLPADPPKAALNYEKNVPPCMSTSDSNPTSELASQSVMTGTSSNAQPHASQSNSVAGLPMKSAVKDAAKLPASSTQMSVRRQDEVKKHFVDWKVGGYSASLSSTSPGEANTASLRLAHALPIKGEETAITSAKHQLGHKHGCRSEDTLSTVSDGTAGPVSSLVRSDDSFLNAELGLTEDHFSLPEGHFGMSTSEELEMAVENCKELILNTPVNSTDRRKALVQKLVQLRLKLLELKDEGVIEEEPDVKVVLGHKFVKREQSKSYQHHCEKCCTLIWGMLQLWYRCKKCGFRCHGKCLNLITRTCASVKVHENPVYILNICPEVGLDTQNYRCGDCHCRLPFDGGTSPQKQCDYTGLYYCRDCHWSDMVPIPARILHNWDFEPRKVCRASKQYLRLMQRKPVIRLQDINPMMFNFVDELGRLKKQREEIIIMKRYFLACKDALVSGILLQLVSRQHFVDNSDMYALQDLIDLESGTLLDNVLEVHGAFVKHIKSECQLCQAKGYICELCAEEDVIFPFDDLAIVCDGCSAVFHRSCFRNSGQQCPKCRRRSHRVDEPSGSSRLPLALGDAIA
ncbi:PREDICTED: uncharacterized protein LOC106815331 isoform X3 [Priapulus caudatus]|uniref:Uncharacterized protein LOC106815331 isoform X3 n=1 Tax=Priapulus caudatus TaxID=37621 RepID=A0ABM1ESX3_PRICU|nr:PREDICTED: uncharacterized protein LOC106815331 isoform X3 [Priapulus caudatus]